MGSGSIMIWRAMECTYGMMGGDMKDNIIMIRSVDMGYICGQMVENMKDGGTKVNSMDLEHIQTKTKAK
jgi:hypothetical protein